MVKCKLCGKHFKTITNTHLSFAHKCSLADYIKKFGIKECGLFSPSLLSKSDPRYKKWRESLKKRSAPWNKGHTKYNHSSVAKISRTFKNKKIDNFAEWREKMKMLGKIKSEYPLLRKDENLAELIGVVLGDGHIQAFPRTERLIVSSNSENKGFINRYANLIKKIFHKKPLCMKAKNENCVRISIYEKFISKRLKVQVGNRSKSKTRTPKWIKNNKKFLASYLRGLYEAEGSFCVHKPTYTYKFLFSNRNKSLLRSVYQGLKILGFHPHKSKYMIQVSRKEEVYRCKDLIKFRKYK